MNSETTLLKSILLETEKEELENFPSEEEIDHEFSAGFEKNMKALIEKQKKKHRRFIDSVWGKVAVIIFIFAIVGGSLFSVEAIREKVFDFYYKVFSRYTEIHFDQSTIAEGLQARTEMDTEYELPFVPDGFDLVSYSTSKWTGVFTAFEDENKNCVYFQQKLNNSGGKPDSENGVVEETAINGYNVLKITVKDVYMYFWVQDGYLFHLWYPIEIGEDYGLSVIGNLKVKREYK